MKKLACFLATKELGNTSTILNLNSMNQRQPAKKVSLVNVAFYITSFEGSQFTSAYRRL